MKLLKDDLGTDLDDRDICRFHRIGKPSTVESENEPSRQIIMKFTSYSARRKVMKARSKLKDSRRPSKVYINEDLTRKRAFLAKLARKAKKDKIINDTWVFDGKIFIKQIDDTVAVATTLEKLKTLVNIE